MTNYKLNQTGEQIQNALNLIDSNTATSGQVLTADGNGGASWQDASGGGGTQLYRHILKFTDKAGRNYPIQILFYCDKSSTFVSISELRTYLQSKSTDNVYYFSDNVFGSFNYSTTDVDTRIPKSAYIIQSTGRISVSAYALTIDGSNIKVNTIVPNLEDYYNFDGDTITPL